MIDHKIISAALSSLAAMVHKTLADSNVINLMMKSAVFLMHISVLTVDNES
jgi:hypothetical protein